MSLPVINPGIAALEQAYQSDPTSNAALYNLYTRYYANMVNANACDTPEFVPQSNELDENGIPTSAFDARVASGLASFNEILMRNAAYTNAVAVLSSIGGSGGGSGGSGYVQRSGDSMLGLLYANMGFQAGCNNTRIFDTTIITENEGTDDEADVSVAHVYGRLLVDENVGVTGKLSIGNTGLYFGNLQVLFSDGNGRVTLVSPDIRLYGDVEGMGTITVGDIEISSTGITNDGDEYYHEGNSNLPTVDWTAHDMEVFGNLTVHGSQTFSGALTALHGFSLGADGDTMFCSVVQEESGVVVGKWLNLKSVIDMDTDAGLKYNSKFILKTYVDSSNEYRVDFGAPGMKLILGAPDGATQTSKIILATDIRNYADTYRIISSNGDGNFPNSLSAGCANAGPTVLQTYYTSQTNCGVIFQKLIRLNSATGPSLSIGSDEYKAALTIPYVHTGNGGTVTEQLPLVLSYELTTSLFKNLSLAWSASLAFDLNNANAEFFKFKKPVEATFFAPISETYKTKLGENILFFNDGVFLEGVVGGIFHSGNATYSGSLSSTAFSSGFAGSGWAVRTDQLYGGYEATVDSLVVRKKMRVYELEVQKLQVTNGSVWVSDACSGDSVLELV
jgi:hypothetical protein